MYKDVAQPTKNLNPVHLSDLNNQSVTAAVRQDSCLGENQIFRENFSVPTP